MRRNKSQILQLGSVSRPLYASSNDGALRQLMSLDTRSGLSKLQKIAVKTIIDFKPLQTGLKQVICQRLLRRCMKQRCLRSFHSELKKRNLLNQGLFGGLVNWGKDRYNDAKRWGERALEAGKSIASQIGEATKGAWSAAINAMKDALDAIGSTLGSALDSVTEFFEALDPSAIMRKVIEAFQTAIDELGRGVKGAVEGMSFIADASGLTEFLTTIRGVIEAAAAAVYDTLGSAVEGVRSTFNLIRQSVASETKKVVDVVSETLDGTMGAILEQGEQATSKFAGLAEDAFNASVSGVASISSQAASKMSSATESIGNSFKQLGKEIEAQSRSTGDSIVQTAESIGTTVSSSLEAAVSAATSSAETAFQSVAALGDTVWETTESIGSKFEDLFDQIWSIMKQVKSWFGGAVTTIASSVTDKLIPAITKLLTDMLSYLMPSFSGTNKALAGVVAAVVALVGLVVLVSIVINSARIKRLR